MLYDVITQSRSESGADCEAISVAKDVYHGIELVDEYRWLEDGHSQRTRDWITEQTTRTRAYLDALPGRGTIRKRVEELQSFELIDTPVKVGSRIFFVKRAPNREQRTIMMRDTLQGEDIILVDPAEKRQGSAVAVTFLDVSGDGQFLVYAVKNGGEDSQEIEILDIDRKTVLSDRLPRGYFRGLAFSSDMKGFYYSHESLSCSRPHLRTVKWHAFGTRMEDDVEIFSAGEDPRLHLLLLSASGSNYLGYYLLRSLETVTVDFLVHDPSSSASPKCIVQGMTKSFRPTFAEDKIVVATQLNAPNGRIVEINPKQPEPRHWREIVHESQSRIETFVVWKRKLFLKFTNNLRSRIEVYDFHGVREHVIHAPDQGTLTLFAPHAASEKVFWSFTSFNRPPTVFTWTPGSADHEPLAESNVRFEASSMVVTQVRYLSKDGTSVPMSLVVDRNRIGCGPLPTVLSCYGGFGVNLTPRFTAYGTFLIEQGFLFAVANLRGGSEFGEQWHEAGKRHHKQNTIDDLIAAAEWLVANGYSKPSQIAIVGGSNAGLICAAAITQRPELFRAAICMGPLLDMLRFHLFDATHRWIDEYGCSENSSDFQALYSYSPYHRVKNGTQYPSVLFISGDADTRCNPMHVRKMTARMQAATLSSNPILLDYRPMWGHSPVQPLQERINALTDRLGFLCHELDVDLKRGEI